MMVHGKLEYLVKARNGRFVWVDSSAPIEHPYFFDTYQDALKIQEKVGGEIMSVEESGYNINESKLQEADEEIELQDVDNEDEEDIENDFDEVINDFKNASDFYEFVVDDIENDCEDYEGETLKDKMIARCDDISEHGCVSGMVSSLIYYSDTTAVFDKYADDIYDLIESYDPDTFLDVLKTHVNTTEIILNCDTSKNWIVWLAYEDVAFTLAEKLREL